MQKQEELGTKEYTAETGRKAVGISGGQLKLKTDEATLSKRMADIEKKYRLDPKSVTPDEIAELKTWYRMQQTKKMEAPSPE
jgi:hypothetical protein